MLLRAVTSGRRSGDLEDHDMLEFRSGNERSTWSGISRRVEGVDENGRIGRDVWEVGGWRNLEGSEV